MTLLRIRQGLGQQHLGDDLQGLAPWPLPLPAGRQALPSGPSTRRAMKGMQPTVSGTMAAMVPMLVPTMKPGQRNDGDQQNDEGHRATDVDDDAQDLVEQRIGQIWPALVTCSATPSGRPSRQPNRAGGKHHDEGVAQSRNQQINHCFGHNPLPS